MKIKILSKDSEFHEMRTKSGFSSKICHVSSITEIKNAIQDHSN